MTGACSVVALTLDDVRCALPLSCVERVVRVVEITPLPEAPEVVLGVINVQGRVVPVADLRRRLRLPARAISLGDLLLIAHTSRRCLAVLADTVQGVVECPAGDVAAAHEILPDLQQVAGVAKLADGLLLIHDLDGLLALDEESALDAALGNTQT
jgi:purine-binding chemotaxis protein CheW